VVKILQSGSTVRWDCCAASWDFTRTQGGPKVRKNGDSRTLGEEEGDVNVTSPTSGNLASCQASLWPR